MSVDELAVLDGGKCILQLRGVRPFLSNKYDLTKHPLYRYTADYDKKYALDIERFLSHRLKLKPDDAVEVYQADLSGRHNYNFSVFHRFNRFPFVVTMGNHDAEHMAKDSIYDLLQKSPYYVGRSAGFGKICATL